MNRFENMSCERVEAMLPAFAGRDLSAEEAAMVSAHVDSCAACREALAAFVSLERTLVARRDEIPPVDAFLPDFSTVRSAARRGFWIRCLRAATSVPGVAIMLVVWATLLVARYSGRWADDVAGKTSLERLTALAQRGLDAIVAAAGGDVWTLTAVYGALAIGVIVSAGALTMRLVRD